MQFIKRYKEMNTDLKLLFRDIIKELQNEIELVVVEEKNGEVNGVQFLSVTATRSNIPKNLVGSLREVIVTITGDPVDYLIELHTGSWLGNLEPNNHAKKILGPAIGAVACGNSGILASEYERHLKTKLKELVIKNSKSEYSPDKIEILTY
jgi:hypothetical protein